MRHLKLLFTFAAALLLAACDSNTGSYDGYPFGLKYNNLRGPVKYYVVSDYTDGYVSSAERYDYSPEGILLKKVYYAKGDSAVTVYSYDEDNNIKDIMSPDVAKFTPVFEGGRLVRENFYTNEAKTEGIRFTFTYDDEGRVATRVSGEIGSSDETTVTFDYNGAGTRSAINTVYADGGSKKAICDIYGNEISSVRRNKSGDVTRRDSTVYEYDSYGNWTKATTLRRGVVIDYRTRSFHYYDGTTVAAPAESVLPSGHEAKAPGGVLTLIIFVLTVFLIVLILRWANRRWGVFSEWAGPVRDDGMRRLWMYNYQPYLKTGVIVGSVMVAFIAAVFLLLLLGGVTWLLFWIIKIILWAIIIIGWICLIGGVVLILTGAGFVLGIIPAIIGIIIVAFQDSIERWAETFMMWGENFFASVNVFDWAVAVFETYGAALFGIIMLIVFAFLSIALLLMFVSLVLRGIEFAVMKIYSVKRPCPFCGNSKSKEFVYMVDGVEYPMNPSPGVYGVFHQTNHFTGTRVPTMLLNGKAKLTRKCLHCDRLVNTAGDNVQGTPVHVGIVGNRSSGKSYMLYSALELLQKKHGDAFTQVDADRNNKIAAVAKRIHEGAGIQTVVRDRYKAVQATLKVKLRPMPYHLFFYDVAGEMFDVNAARKMSAMEFYNNVGIVIFVIDPSMLDISSGDAQPSSSFTEWLEAKCGDTEKYDIEGTLSKLGNILERQGRRLKDIDLIVTCTKADLGYLQACGFGDSPTEQDIRKFVRDDLGLYNADNNINNTFRSVGYAAVSVNAGYEDTLVRLFVRALATQGLKDS